MSCFLSVTSTLSSGIALRRFSTSVISCRISSAPKFSSFLNTSLSCLFFIAIADLSREAEEAEFAGHQLAVGEFEEQYQKEFHFDLWKNDSQTYHNKIDGILKVLKEETQGREKVEGTIKEWKEKIDPEPERHPDTMAARAELDKEGIPYLPFFAAVEFKKEVSAVVRERLESAITRMGFLDALIVPAKYSNKLVKHDRVLKPNPHIIAYTLGNYLYPTPPKDKEGVTSADIDNILRSPCGSLAGYPDFSRCLVLSLSLLGLPSSRL